MINKLSTIDICVANITYTYDIGLMFDVLSSEGVSSEEGYNIGQWPCFKLTLSNKTKEIIYQLKNGQKIEDKCLLENKLFRELCTYHSYNGNYLVDDETLATCLDYIKTGLKEIDDQLASIYAYVSLEDWDFCLSFFPTYSEMVEFFYERWNGYCRNWEEMNNEEIEKWYNIAEENKWGGVPYMEVNE